MFYFLEKAMSTRKIATIANPDNSMNAYVRYNSELQEYKVCFFQGATHLKNSDYFTSDKADAISTARIAVGLDPK
jgi:hypothetical protein